MANSASRLTMMLALLALCVGCSGEEKGPRTVTAEGVVTLDGTPVEGAAVVFIDDGGQYPARGYTDADGKFSLDAFEYKHGAVPGSYKAVVTKTIDAAVTDPSALKGEEAEHAGEEVGQMIKNALPNKYAMPNPSFAFTVPEEGTSDLRLELSSN